MSPDEILEALALSHRELVAEERRNPDGWAFFLGQPRGGTKSNRILRATRSSAGAVTELKLAVSSRHDPVEKTVRFSGDAVALRELVDSELQLFRKHFADRDEGTQLNKPSIDGPRSAKRFIVVEAETKSELERKVEAAWLEGYRPSGGIAINRDPVNYALYYLQGMTLEEGPST